jgi:hypothetical protein
MLEIMQTLILSVVVWYHLTFFVISLALFGLSAGAVWDTIPLLVLFFISLIFVTATVVVPLGNALQDVRLAVAVRGTAISP